MAINEIEHCEHTEVHAETVQAVREHMPAEDELYDLAELFKVFGDSTRIRILLGMTQSAISHQLRILKNAKLVKNKRDGKQVIYFLADEHVRSIINQGLEHIEE